MFVWWLSSLDYQFRVSQQRAVSEERGGDDVKRLWMLEEALLSQPNMSAVCVCERENRPPLVFFNICTVFSKFSASCFLLLWKAPICSVTLTLGSLFLCAETKCWTSRLVWMNRGRWTGSSFCVWWLSGFWFTSASGRESNPPGR